MTWQYPVTGTSSAITVDLHETDSAYVAAQVAVTSAGIAAIRGTGSSHQVIVDGTVAANWAIQLGDDAAADMGQSVTVNEGGKLFAERYGILVYGYDSVVYNYGVIDARNLGVGLIGVSTVTRSSFINAGSVTGDHYGVTHSGSEAFSLINSGTITGGDYSFQMNDTSNDSVRNTGKMVGDIDMGRGNDIYNGRAGSVDGDVHGSYGADKLLGGSEKNVLYGDAGADQLDGGKGNDVLTGGADSDTFIFSTGYGRDKIADFDAKGSDHDRLDLSGLKSIDNFADLKAHHIEKLGTSVVIDGTHGDTITLEHVKLGDLDASDFIF